MGSASLIATAISLVLLIVTAYVVVGGILTAADIITMSQAERFSLQESRMGTSIDIFDITVSNETSTLSMIVNNSGREKISQFKYMDIYIIQGTQPILIPYTTAPGTNNTWYVTEITPDLVHPSELDPGESVTMKVKYAVGIAPVWIKVTTPNGVYDSAYINS